MNPLEEYFRECRAPDVFYFVQDGEPVRFIAVYKTTREYVLWVMYHGDGSIELVSDVVPHPRRRQYITGLSPAEAKSRISEELNWVLLKLLDPVEALAYL